MTITLYDLAGADPERRFSPYCWRTKLALAHKGLPFTTIPWRFTEKDAIAISGQGKVPVMIDGGRVVFDSWTIAEYLEEAYPNRPSLFGGARGAIRFVANWADSVLLPAMARLILIDVFRQLDARDKAYFRASREERYGRTLDALCAGREARVAGFRELLQPLRMSIRERPHLGGDAPDYADMAVFGSFLWPRMTSPFPLLDEADPVWAWRERMFDAFPAARAAPALGV